MKKVVLCGKPQGCCPEVWKDEENVYIVDDHDGAVQITREQFDILKEKISNGEL